MLEYGVLWLTATLLACIAAYRLGSRTQKTIPDTTVPIVVEEYKLSTEEKEGFQKLIVKFQDGTGRIYPFEFHPAYAHALSDELVKHAARSLAPKG